MALTEAGRAAAEIIRAALAESELDFSEADPGSFVVNLPGTRKLKTACWLILGTSGLTIEAFVVRKPDEHADRVHAWLLAHNAKMFGVSWATDDVGDIYLTGRWPFAAVTPDSIDQLLGAVLEYADSSFNTLLELGFGTSIRREWAWRTSRGESTANLAAFRGFIERGAGATEISGTGQASP